MKKVILFFSVLFLSTTLTFGQTATLSVPELGGGISPGSVFIPVTIDATSGDVFGTFQFFFTYDPAVLTPVGDWAASPAATGIQYTNPNFPFYEWLNNPAYAPGEVLLTWLSFTGTVVPAAGEVICILEFAYTGDPDYSDFAWNFTPDGKGKEAGWIEKGVSGLWTFAGDEFALTTVDGSVGPTAVAADEWTGAAGTDWNDNGNWFDGSYATIADDVLIPAGLSNYPNFSGYEAACNNLEIESGASVTIQATGGLNAAGAVLCNGAFNMYSNAANPLSNSSGFRYGSIDGASTGTFLYDRMVEAYPAGDEFLGWHYIASPIAGFENWDMYNYWVNYWDETASGVDPDFPWVHMEGSPTIPCDPAPLMAIGDMEGWSVKQDYDYLCNATNPGTDDHILFQGDFTDIHDAVDYTRAYTNTGGHSAQGYNLMGNPYPSWIDMTDFAGLNVHIWDGSADTYLNWAGGGDFTEIPPTQGFFVYEGLPGTPLAGDLTISKANTVYGTQPFEKSEMNEVVLMATGNDKQDKTYIRFSEEATAAYDNSGIDAYKLMGTGTAPQIYTVTNGEEFSINTLDETPIVPMSFFAAQSAEYTIEAIETGEFANVVLEDRFTGEQTDLLTGSYTFNYTVNDDADRFFVHFTPLGIGDNLANSIDIWSNDHKIYVQAPAINGDIVVFNMMGQEVIRTEIEPGLNTIPVNDRNSYYVVKVVSSDVARTGKVYVK